MRRVLSILIFWNVSFLSLSQTRFENITKEHGLFNDFILSVQHDQQGHIWLGTYAGLQRSDGNELQFFNFDPDDILSISNNITHAIFQDAKARLWFGTEKDLNLFNPTNHTFKRFYTPSKILQELAKALLFIFCYQWRRHHLKS